MAGGAVNRAVPRAIAVELLSGNRLIGVGGKRGIGGCAVIPITEERSRITLAVVVAHLARRLIQPPRAGRCAYFAQIAMTIGAELCVHRSAFALGDGARVAQ